MDDLSHHLSTFPFFANVFKEQVLLKLPVPSTPLNGKTVVVTGANVGLGLETCRHAVRLRAAVVIMACRNIEAGNAAKKDILASVKDAETDIRVQPLDQASFASVKNFIDELKKLDRLDFLILNAAVWLVGQWEVTSDGWERQLQVNSLSPAYIALSLLDKMNSNSDTSALKPHISLVCSDGHKLFQFPYRTEQNILQYMNSEEEWKRGDFLRKDRYPPTKLFNIYTAQKIAEYLGDDNSVVINTPNPGFTKTELFRDVPGVTKIGAWAMSMLGFVLGRKAEDGSRNLCHAAFGCGDETQGKYMSACRVATPGRWAKDTEEAKRVRDQVWREIGEVLIKLDPTLEKYFSENASG